MKEQKKKPTCYILIFFISVITQTTAGDRRYNNEYQLQKSRSNNRSNYGNTKSSEEKLTSENNANGKIKRSGFGLSAWGLIALIIGAIVVSTSGYYAFLFYPFLCKKERNYDMIELANV